MKFIEKSHSLYTKDIHLVSLRKVFVKIKILFSIRIRIRILLWISIPDLHSIHRRHHQILFGSANSFESYCVHMKSPRMYIRHADMQTDRQTDRQREIFFCSYCLLTYTKHEHPSKGENFFFSVMGLQYFLVLHTPYVMRK